MADAEEDAIPTGPGNAPEDLEDEAQDFRFLAQLTTSSGMGQAIVPKRGMKDFEPNPTRSQASALDASRLAMYTALGALRIHAARDHHAGQYLPNENDWRWDDDGGGVKHGRCVVVQKFKGTHSKTMGVADKNNWVWLLPEEALFLLERGSLDIRWPNIDDDDHGAIEDTPEFEVGELPMSLQGAYASLIGKDGLTLERYNVYAGLKRAGYVVRRAPTWHDRDPPQANGHAQQQTDPRPELPSTVSTLSGSTAPHPRAVTNAVSLIHRLVSWIFQPSRQQSCPSLGPLVAPGLYRNYADIFRALSLVPYHDFSRASTLDSNSIAHGHGHSPNPNPPAPFRVHLHAWKPNAAQTYRKTAPPPPDYRIVVIDARTTSVPTLAQIGSLLDAQPEDALSKDKAGRLETRLKHGRRNVMLAIVDMGVISYLRLSDACFGAEKLFKEKLRPRTKGRWRPAGGGGGAAKKGQSQRQGQRRG